MTLSIVIVNYKSSVPLKDCLDSILSSRLKVDYEIIVVDNHSFDSGLDEIKEKYGQVRFIDLPTNEGFAGGNNAGIKQAQGEVLLLLNPDTVVEPDALQVLLDKLVSNDNVGIVGPKIYYGDKSLQTKVVAKKVPDLKKLFFELFYIDKMFPDNETLNSYYGSAKFDFDREQYLEQVTGSCLMIKRDVIDQIGLMDDNYFLYFDETDWCYRALQAGYNVMYVPSAVITHFEGVSSDTVKRRSVEAFYESELYFFRKHYGIISASALYVLNIFGFMYRLLFVPMYLIKDRNTVKTKRFLWALFYHLNPLHYAKVFISHPVNKQSS